MDSTIKTGDRVRFRAGKGYAEGRVINVNTEMVTIESAKGKYLNRLMSAVELVPVSVPGGIPNASA